MTRTILWIAAIIAVVGAIGISFLLGQNHALGSLHLADATPDQMALAMNKDDFYGTYHEQTLIVHGVVAGVSQQDGDTVIQFQTSTLFKAYCDIGTATTSAATGSTIRVAAEGFTAQRLTDGVMLTGCMLL